MDSFNQRLRGWACGCGIKIHIMIVSRIFNGKGSAKCLSSSWVQLASLFLIRSIRVVVEVVVIVVVVVVVYNCIHY